MLHGKGHLVVRREDLRSIFFVKEIGDCKCGERNKEESMVEYIDRNSLGSTGPIMTYYMHNSGVVVRKYRIVSA